MVMFEVWLIIVLFLLIVAVPVLIITCCVVKRRNRNHTQHEKLEEGRSKVSDALSYDKAYQKKWLLTMNEKTFYRQLNSFAARKDMTVFTKVRLLDLLEPVKNQPKYKTYFYKVQAKHVDFVLCDAKLVARYIIELDDSSHAVPDRAERDVFVDTVLRSVGYKVLRLKAFDETKIEQAFFHASAS